MRWLAKSAGDDVPLNHTLLSPTLYNNDSCFASRSATVSVATDKIVFFSFEWKTETKSKPSMAEQIQWHYVSVDRVVHLHQCSHLSRSIENAGPASSQSIVNHSPIYTMNIWLMPNPSVSTEIAVAKRRSHANSILSMCSCLCPSGSVIGCECERSLATKWNSIKLSFVKAIHVYLVFFFFFFLV